MSVRVTSKVACQLGVTSKVACQLGVTSKYTHPPQCILTPGVCLVQVGRAAVAHESHRVLL